MICQCGDAQCEVNHGSHCQVVLTSENIVHLHREDYDEHFVMCEDCADDALRSGMFFICSDED